MLNSSATGNWRNHSLLVAHKCLTFFGYEICSKHIPSYITGMHRVIGRYVKNSSMINDILVNMYLDP